MDKRILLTKNVSNFMKLLAFFRCFLYNGITMYERKYPLMDELTNELANEAVNEESNEVMKEMPPVPVRRQRKKRSKFQIFKEAYLPDVAIVFALLSCIAVMLLCKIYINLFEKKQGGKRHLS